MLSDLQEIGGFGKNSKTAIQKMVNLVGKEIPKITAKKIDKKLVSNTAEFFRYRPLLSTVLEDLISNTLSKDDFPYLKSYKKKKNYFTFF